MSERDQSPFTGSQQKGRHAGDIPSEQGGERPAREFRETPLDVAGREGLLVTPNTIEEGFQHHPLTPEEEKALEKVRKRQAKKDKLPAKRKRAFKMIGAGAVMSLAAGVGGTVYMNSQSGTNPDLNNEPSATAVPNPGEQQTTVTPEVLTVNPDYGYIAYDTNPENLANSYVNFITDTVNERYATGESNIEDLINVTPDTSSSVAVNLDAYIDGLVDNLERAKKTVDKKNLPYEEVMAGIAFNFLDSTQTDNTTTVTLDFEYRVLSDTWDYLGSLLANNDKMDITFSNAGPAELADGSPVNMATIDSRILDQ